MMSIQLSDIPNPYGLDSPILSYCRRLVDGSIDPNTELHVYREDVLAIKVRTIGEGAELTVQENVDGTPVFRPYLSIEMRQ